VTTYAAGGEVGAGWKVVIDSMHGWELVAGRHAVLNCE
jgi:hypothetical protein